MATAMAEGSPGARRPAPRAFRARLLAVRTAGVHLLPWAPHWLGRSAPSWASKSLVNHKPLLTDGLARLLHLWHVSRPVLVAAAAAGAADTTEVMPKPATKSNKEALDAACEGYAASLTLSPAARRHADDVERATNQALVRLKDIEGTIGAVRPCAEKDTCPLPRLHPDCTSVRVCVCTPASIPPSMYVCMHVCMHACMHACMYAFMHVCMHACMHACMYVCE